MALLKCSKVKSAKNVALFKVTPRFATFGKSLYFNNTNWGVVLFFKYKKTIIYLLLFFRPINERRTPAENMAIIKMYGGIMFPNINDLTETPIGKEQAQKL